MTDNPESPSEVKPSDAGFWIREIEAAKARADCWYEAADEAQERYDGTGDDDDGDIPFGSLNILWANVETQKAAIGEDFGRPQVTRVNQPENDGGLSRHVAMVWERSIAAAVRDTNDNHDIALASNDVFIPGRGQVWIEVEAEKDETGKAAWVSAPIVYVKHKDYLQGQADRWGSVPWVARRHTFTRDELVSECGMSKEKAEKVPLNITLPCGDKNKSEDSKGQEQFKRAECWEIWAKYPKKARLFVCINYRDEVLKYDADPFKLKHFFPCPRPLVANGTECTTPLTDYSRYENQASELDEICSRIFVLTASLQRKGVHDKQFKEIADLADIEENTTIAVDNWVELQAKGGLLKVMEWTDLSQVIQILVELYQQRDSLIKLIYELSGISDLARGQTDPNETLGAQQLKQTFGSSRFQRREKESRRFASEAYGIKGEIIAEMFPREQLAAMSGISLPTQAEIDQAKAKMQQVQQIQAAQQQIMQLQQASQQPPQQGQPPAPQPNPQQIAQLMATAQMPLPDEDEMRDLMQSASARFSWEKISKLMQSDYRRCYSVEIETDQTTFIDQEADKKAGTELFMAAVQGMQQLGPMIQGNPKNGEVFKKLFMFMLSRFRAGRSMEEGFETAFDEAIQEAQQSEGQQQDPKAAADAQIAQARLQTAQIGLQKETIKLQQIQSQAGQDQQAKVAEQQAAVMEAEAKQREAAAKLQDSQQKVGLQAQQVQLKGVEGAQKVRQQHMENEAKAVGHQIEMQGKAETLQFERQQRATAREEILVDNHHARQLSEADRHHERRASVEDKQFQRQQSTQDGDFKRQEMAKDNEVKRRAAQQKATT